MSITEGWASEAKEESGVVEGWASEPESVPETSPLAPPKPEGPSLESKLSDILDERAQKNLDIANTYYGDSLAGQLYGKFLAPSVEKTPKMLVNSGATLLELLGTTGIHAADELTDGKVTQTITEIMKALPVEQIKEIYNNLSTIGKQNVDVIFDSLGIKAADLGFKVAGKTKVRKNKRDIKTLNEVIPEPDSVKRREKAFLNNSPYTREQQQLLQELTEDLGIEGLHPLKSKQTNRKYLEAELNKAKLAVNKELAENASVAVKPDVVLDAVIKRVDALAKNPETQNLIKSGNYKNIRNKIDEEFLTALEILENNPTPKGLIKARKAFDNVGEKLFGKDFWENMEHPARQLVSDYRNSFYEVLESVMPTDAARQQIKRQHYLIRAKEQLTHRAATEKGLIRRSTEYASHHWGLPMALAGGGALFGGPLGAALGAVGAIGAGAYGLSRANKYLPLEPVKSAGIGTVAPSLFFGLSPEEEAMR